MAWNFVGLLGESNEKTPKNRTKSHHGKNHDETQKTETMPPRSTNRLVPPTLKQRHRTMCDEADEAMKQGIS